MVDLGGFSGFHESMQPVFPQFLELLVDLANSLGFRSFAACEKDKMSECIISPLKCSRDHGTCRHFRRGIFIARAFCRDIVATGRACVRRAVGTSGRWEPVICFVFCLEAQANFDNCRFKQDFGLGYDDT